VLIVSGRMHVLPDGTKRGFRIVRGGGTFVIPIIEKSDVLSLEVVRVTMPGLRVPSGGTAASVECVAQVKVQTDEASILAAAECFLNKSAGEMQELIRPVLEKHARTGIARADMRDIDQARKSAWPPSRRRRPRICGRWGSASSACPSDRFHPRARPGEPVSVLTGYRPGHRRWVGPISIGPRLA
jgi:hypothetical protein